MKPGRIMIGGLAFVLVAAAGGLAAFGALRRDDTERQQNLHHAYFLEHAKKDPAAAKLLYDSVVSTTGNEELRRMATAGSARCRDRLAAENFAALMPPDTLVYLELKRPGRLLEELASMLGLTASDMAEALARRPSVNSNAPFHVPEQVVISPALFEALSRFGGGAVAMTAFDPDRGPTAGVIVIHHGDLLLVKGLLETFFQFAPTAEKIGDLPTFGAAVPDFGRVVGVLTESLAIVGTTRELVDGAVQRLLGRESASLAAREDLAQVMIDRQNATLFSYVNLQAVMQVVQANLDEDDRREFAAANAICDLDSLRWATLSGGAHQGKLQFQITLRLADSHRSLAYNLVRLPPMSRKSLKQVPPEAAAIIGIGLNPALAMAVSDSAMGDARAVTGLDIGRELFGNIQEISAFVLPGQMTQREAKAGPPVMPNLGFVLAVNDVAKSKALWGQLLTLPGMASGGEPVPPQVAKIGNHDVTTFTIPDLGSLYLTELDGCIAIGTTRSAIKSIIQTEAKGASILNDPTMSGIIENLPKDSSIMLLAHVGRLAKVAAGAGDPGLAIGATQAADLCDRMVFWAGLGQSPNEMTLRVAMAGLPDLNKALKTYGPMLKAMASMAGTATKSKPVKPAKTKVSEAGREAEVRKLTEAVLSASQKADYEKALELALRARKLSDNGLTNYNVACMYARLNRRDEAFKSLSRAAELGLAGSGHDLVDLLNSDSDLDTLRGDPRFEAVMRQAQDRSSRPRERSNHRTRNPAHEL